MLFDPTRSRAGRVYVRGRIISYAYSSIPGRPHTFKGQPDQRNRLPSGKHPMNTTSVAERKHGSGVNESNQ